MEEKKRRQSKNISLVNINNNSPRVFKRSFHSTKSLRFFDFMHEAVTILQLETLQSIISTAVVHVQAQDYGDISVTRAINLLLSKPTGAGTTTQAATWDFDLSLLERKGIASKDVLKELKKVETNMDINLENLNLRYKTAQKLFQESGWSASHDTLRTTLKPK